MKQKMKIKRRINNGWLEVNSLTEEQKEILTFTLDLFGKYQYICSSKKGRISLIHIMTGVSRKKLWEIYSLKGDVFEDIERFATKKEAMKRIKELLQ